MPHKSMPQRDHTLSDLVSILTVPIVQTLIPLLIPTLALADVPYPPSPVIESITWHPDTLRLAAPGSDLWPVTWGPDGHIFTS